MIDPGAEQKSEQNRPAAELLPEVYAELRRLAAALSVKLRPGQTLQPTALALIRIECPIPVCRETKHVPAAVVCSSCVST